MQEIYHNYVMPSSQLSRNATLDYSDEVLYKTLKEYQMLRNFSECDYKINGHDFVTNITVIFLAGVHEFVHPLSYMT